MGYTAGQASQPSITARAADRDCFDNTHGFCLNSSLLLGILRTRFTPFNTLLSFLGLPASSSLSTSGTVGCLATPLHLDDIFRFARLLGLYNPVSRVSNRDSTHGSDIGERQHGPDV